MLRKVGGLDRDLGVRRWLRASVSPLGVLAVLSWAAAGSAQAQTTAPVEKKPEQLEQIDVMAPRPKPRARRATSGAQPAPAPTPAPELTADQKRGANSTPLNTNVIAGSASYLGLTPRQVPAAVEVIDQQILTDRGLRTTQEAVQAATGVTASDAPGSPSILSMRGFVGDQINTLYNGIKAGPSTMTSRP